MPEKAATTPSKYGGQSTTYFQECCNFNIFRKKISPALVRTRQSGYSYYNRIISVVSNYSPTCFHWGHRLEMYMSTRKMRLTVAHNNNTDLIPGISHLPAVESVYGKMAGDLAGGGRNTYLLADINQNQLRQLIDQAHEHNLKYNYILNAPCLSNMETTRKFNDQLFAFIGTLVDMGVDGFVVALPYLLDLIKRHFPKVTVSISTFAIINSISKAKSWEDKGADRIIIQQDQNRDFSLLKKIRKAVSCELELFANNLCMDQCPYPPFHAAFNAHGSANHQKTKGFALDYCGFQCARKRLENPVEFIRGRFIRPEDIHLYENIGIDVFKLADRIKSTKWITNVVTAYNNRYYDGNLVDLIGYPFMRQHEDDSAVGNPAKWLVRPDFIHMDMVKEIRHLGDAGVLVHIDNRKLDGFCEYFVKHDCRTAICDEECTHCAKYAQRAIQMNEAAAAERIARHQKVLDMMVDRTAFTAEPYLKQLVIRTVSRASGLLQRAKTRRPAMPYIDSPVDASAPEGEK